MESRGRHFLQKLQAAIEGCERLIAVIGPGGIEAALCARRMGACAAVRACGDADPAPGQL